MNEQEGRISGMDFTSILGELWRDRATGALVQARDGDRRTLWLDKGELVFAASTRAEDRLGEMLLRAGVIGLDMLEGALEDARGGRRLGSLMVDKGIIRESDLPRVIANHLREVALAAFSWDAAAISFEAGSAAPGDPVQFPGGTSRLLVEGIRRCRDWRRIRGATGGSHARWVAVDGALELPETALLAPEEREVLGWLADPLTVADTCSSVFIPNFEVCRILWALSAIGLIERVEGSDGAAGIETGQLRARSFVRLLVSLCRRGETGLLCVRRPGEEKTVHLREGQVVFATSSRPEDSLSTLLLSRGVVGLREIEAIEKRRLSGKRIGTLLVEAGALSRSELSRYLGEQLTAIVLSMFGWSDGEYVFEGGGLPTIEPLTVGVTLEALVLRGVRTVTAWDLVKGGSGGPEARLRVEDVSPALEDLMQADGEVAEVARALKEPGTIAEVCRSRRMQDFRVCQIVWGLRELGVLALALETERPVAAPGPRRETRLAAAVGELETELGAPEAPGAAEHPPEATAQADGAADVEPDVPEPPEPAGRAEAIPAPESEPQATAETEAEAPGDARLAPPVPVNVLAGRTAAGIAPELFGPDAKYSGTPEAQAAQAAEPPTEGAAVKSAPAEAAPAADAAEDSDSSGELILAVVEGFSKRHRILFESVRSEIGAGAANFLRRSAKGLHEAHASAVPANALRPDGQWDPAKLKAGVEAAGLEAGRAGLEALLGAELTLARGVLSEKAFEKMTERIAAEGDARSRVSP